MKKVIIAFLVFATIALACAIMTINSKPASACGRDMIEYTDLVGRKVLIKKDVRRIVLLRSKDVYLLAALLGDDLPARLCAWGPDLKVDDAEVYKRLTARFPGLAKTTVTGDVYSDGLSVEQLLQLAPDLVIADKYMIERGYKYTGRIEAAGLPVAYLDGSSDPLTGPQRGLRFLGKVLNKEARAEEISSFIDRRIQSVVSRIATNKPPAPSVYLEAGHLGPEGYGQSYGYSGVNREHTSWGTILQALQVRNIADGRVVGMAPISPEALLAANPEIVVITGQNWARFRSPGAMQLGFNVKPGEAAGLLEGFTRRPGWELISAVRDRRVYSVFHNTVSPTVFSAVEALGKYCYPGLFPDIDPDTSLHDFYVRFMPIALDGTWACSLERNQEEVKK